MLAIKGSVLAVDDPRLQDACSTVYESQQLYVARHRQYVVKRTQDTGKQHRPDCSSYEPDPQKSGLGELMAEAVLEREAGQVELRADFPRTRAGGRGVARSEPREVGEVGVS